MNSLAQLLEMMQSKAERPKMATKISSVPEAQHYVRCKHEVEMSYNPGDHRLVDILMHSIEFPWSYVHYPNTFLISDDEVPRCYVRWKHDKSKIQFKEFQIVAEYGPEDHEDLEREFSSLTRQPRLCLVNEVLIHD